MTEERIAAVLKLIYYFAAFTFGGYAWAQAIQQPSHPASGGFTLTWEAAGSLVVIATGIVAMTWFVVSMAINSAIETLRRELGDPERGFVSAKMCSIQHAATQGEIREIKESLK